MGLALLKLLALALIASRNTFALLRWSAPFPVGINSIGFSIQRIVIFYSNLGYVVCALLIEQHLIDNYCLINTHKQNPHQPYGQAKRRLPLPGFKTTNTKTYLR